MHFVGQGLFENGGGTTLQRRASDDIFRDCYHCEFCLPNINLFVQYGRHHTRSSLKVRTWEVRCSNSWVWSFEVSDIECAASRTLSLALVESSLGTPVFSGLRFIEPIILYGHYSIDGMDISILRMCVGETDPLSVGKDTVSLMEKLLQRDTKGAFLEFHKNTGIILANNSVCAVTLWRENNLEAWRTLGHYILFISMF